jgi:phosphoribosylglycinamide formyltransferase-1
MMAPDGTEPRILVLVSGTGTNLQSLIEATKTQGFPGRIVAVGSNRPEAPALGRAAQAGVDTFVVDHTRYETRQDFDGMLRAQINRYAPDLIVMAGFMRILTTEFVRAFHGQMLNIHPSLLPKYPGLDTHRRALAAGDNLHGATIHFVTEDLDGGPVVAQADLTIKPDDTPETLAKRVQEKEHLLYPIVVRWFCEGRLQLAGDEVLFDGELLTAPFYLED